MRWAQIIMVKSLILMRTKIENFLTVLSNHRGKGFSINIRILKRMFKDRAMKDELHKNSDETGIDPINMMTRLTSVRKGLIKLQMVMQKNGTRRYSICDLPDDVKGVYF